MQWIIMRFWNPFWICRGRSKEFVVSIDVEPNLYLLEAKYESHSATIYELKCILCSMRFVVRDGAIKYGEVLCFRILGPPGFHCTILYIKWEKYNENPSVLRHRSNRNMCLLVILLIVSAAANVELKPHHLLSSQQSRNLILIDHLFRNFYSKIGYDFQFKF